MSRTRLLRPSLLAMCAGLLVASVSQAAPVTCVPKPFGTGTSALFKFPAKGAFVAWYCPGEELPTMFVCTKATCNAVTTQRAVAALFSAPSVSAITSEVARAKVKPAHFTDPALVQVWSPFADEIKALK